MEVSGHVYGEQEGHGSRAAHNAILLRDGAPIPRDRPGAYHVETPAARDAPRAADLHASHDAGTLRRHVGRRREAGMEAERTSISPIMLILLWRRRLYGGWRYYAITN